MQEDRKKIDLGACLKS